MIPFDNEQEYWIVYGKTDLRKGIDSLAILIQQAFNHDPFDGAYYLFCGSRLDRFKVLHWDGEGFQLIYKRLENGRLHWPRTQEPCLKRLNISELELLFKGFPIKPSIQKSSKKILF